MRRPDGMNGGHANFYVLPGGRMRIELELYPTPFDDPGTYRVVISSGGTCGGKGVAYNPRHLAKPPGRLPPAQFDHLMNQRPYSVVAAGLASHGTSTILGHALSVFNPGSSDVTVCGRIHRGTANDVP